ncbi:MAG: methionyl-tRNA formyltransferase [Oscillospiraceae bacterium]|nr:methionyl-tRNA formyltransferase [Candidatus Equicaccousia limihippi]
MKIVFMGTPDFAVGCLKSLHEKYGVCAVFCNPDKPVGRKHIMTAPPTKVYANEQGISVYQPATLKSDEVFDILSDIAPDYIVVVAYGKILPKRIIDLPENGCINVHGSLLPKYRGASPIQWAIVNGDTKSGVTTMYMDEGVDTGDMLLSKECEITDCDTYETLHDKLSVMGADLLIETIAQLEKGTLKPTKQGESDSYAPIITKEMSRLDFSKPAKELYNLVRAFNPWPNTFFETDRRIKVISAKVGVNSSLPCGTVEIIDGKPHVVCGDGITLELVTICPEGSKKMSGADAVIGRIFKNE